MNDKTEEDKIKKVKLTTHESIMVIPCPFCESEHIMHFGTNGDSIYCRTCNAEGPGAISETVEEAAYNWNKAGVSSQKEKKTESSRKCQSGNSSSGGRDSG